MGLCLPPPHTSLPYLWAYAYPLKGEGKEKVGLLTNLRLVNTSELLLTPTGPCTKLTVGKDQGYATALTLLT